jgi:hypothetical protein
MSLKIDRQVDAVELRYFLNETASRGVVVSAPSHTASGVAMEDTLSVATVAANSSGAKPLGVLAQDVVDLDLTRISVNWHKDQANKGDKVTIITKGWVVTDQTFGTCTGGEDAVLSSSGAVTNKATDGTHNEQANPTVGRFRTSKDQAGFAALYIDL